MTLLVPIAALEARDIARVDAVLGNLLHWIRHEPRTQEEYFASMAALADVDSLRAYLGELQRGGA